MTETLEYLIDKNVLPPDSVVISSHNNLVVSSEAQAIVSRITTQQRIATNTDPGNFYYSHRIAWELGESGSAVSPVDEEPIEFENFVISNFPKREPISWEHVSASSLASAIGKLNSFSPQSLYIDGGVRRMNIAGYAQARLDSLAKNFGLLDEKKWVQEVLNNYRLGHNFSNIALAEEAIVHGDLHSGNIVMDTDFTPLFIDLDSVTVGPRTYDLASWCVRALRGDEAPIQEAAAIALSEKGSRYNRSSFEAMVGWKAISSMTHALKYNPEDASNAIVELSSIARALNAPGSWNI